MSGTPSQIGPYAVASELGRGGMGVVYLATDSRLGRQVAIKALPEHFATDPERLARFEREARTLASLNHPNVAGIHGVEEHDGRKYLVLEYVEGITLADRLDRGALPVDEALEICAQVAAGLEAAHEAGVIHRDLKPANIRITPEGQAKVLDFGLARTEEATSSGSSVSQMPTLTTPHSPTQAGAILGTAPYMSPEQARGRRVDKRSDIWSFGVLLYECLTGMSPFIGETATDSIGAILHKDVDLNRLPTGTPVGVRRVLSRCLQRDKALRYRDIGDARLDLTLHDGDAAAEAQPSGSRWTKTAVALAAVVLVAVGAWLIGGMTSSRPGAIPGPIHVAIPTTTADGLSGAGSLAFDIAPNRRDVVFVGGEIAPAGSVRSCLFVRTLDKREIRKIPGTEHASWVSIFPDGGQAIFVWNDPDNTREELRRVAISGGPIVTLLATDSGPGYDIDTGIVWRSSTSFLVLGGDRLTLYEHSLETSETTVVVDIAELVPGGAFVMPDQVLDNGRSLVCSIAQADPQRGPVIDIFHIDLQDRVAKRLASNAGDAFVFDEGRRIAFIRENAICVAQFDAASKTVVGEPTPLIAPVSNFKISPTGDLYFVDAPTLSGGVRPVLLTADGQRQILIDTPAYLLSMVGLSPDGRFLGLTRRPSPTGPPEAIIVDLETGFINPLLRSTAPASHPVWIDGEQIAYLRFSSFARMELHRLHYGVEQDSQPITPLDDDGGVQFLPAFSPDGRWMAYEFANALDAPKRDIYIAPLDGQGPPRSIVDSSAVDTLPAFSPDGSLLAYCSDSAGEYRIVMRAFDSETGDVGARVIPVSLGHGRNPVWSPDGQWLYFAGRGELLRVNVQREPTLLVSVPEVFLSSAQLDGLSTFGDRAFVIMPDGERFVFLEQEANRDPSTHINLTIGWLDELSDIFPIQH